MKNNNLEKVVRQHAEMEDFFSGGLIVKGQKSPTQSAESQPPENNVDLELKKVAQEVEQCSKCDLSTTRTKTVPGQGSPNARIFFIGEAPGADEDLQGKPFIGRAGQLLGKMILAMGLERGDVFIGNILKCRPPGNRDPRPEEIVRCLPYLKRQIELIKPEVIIALGAHAARTLLETKKPIGQLRGRFHGYHNDESSEPVKLMPTYHPAYLLRNYSKDNRKKVWDDIKTVMAELDMQLPPE